MEKQSTDQYDRHSSGEAPSDSKAADRKVAKPTRSKPKKARKEEEFLYFFPDQEVTEEQVRAALKKGTEQEKLWAISHLLRYAQWDEIWTYVSREDVRDLFSQLELPTKLQEAWGRLLDVKAETGR